MDQHKADEETQVMETALDVLEGLPHKTGASRSERHGYTSSRSVHNAPHAPVLRKRQACPARISGYAEWSYPVPRCVEVGLGRLTSEFGLATEMLGVHMAVVCDNGTPESIMIGDSIRHMPDEAWAYKMADAHRTRAMLWLIEFLKACEKGGYLMEVQDHLESFLWRETKRDEKYINQIMSDAEERNSVGPTRKRKRDDESLSLGGMSVESGWALRFTADDEPSRPGKPSETRDWISRLETLSSDGSDSGQTLSAPASPRHIGDPA